MIAVSRVPVRCAGRILMSLVCSKTGRSKGLSASGAWLGRSSEHGQSQNWPIDPLPELRYVYTVPRGSGTILLSRDHAETHRHSTFSTFSTSLCHVTQRDKGERPSTGQRTLCRWGRATWKDVTQERSTVTVGRRSHGLHPGASPSRFPRSLRPPRLASPPLSVSAARLSPTSWCRGCLRRMRPRHGATSRARRDWLSCCTMAWIINYEATTLRDED